MIKHLQIKNFKSIKELEFDCSRVNIFIGEPNTGKSNLLETIGLLSFAYTGKLKDFVRYHRMSNIFYNSDINEPIYVEYLVDLIPQTVNKNNQAPEVQVKHSVELKFKDNNSFQITSSGADFLNSSFNSTYRKNDSALMGSSHSGTSITAPLVRFFKFKNIKFEKADDIYVLKPPDGSNLMNVIQTNKEVRQFAAELIAPFGFKFRLSTESGNIEFSREYQSVIFDFPFELLSDTFIKIIMLYAAIETSKKHILVLEEPEAHVFPFYNKFLAERIALYNTNQFFIATHNPTFLANIIEQTPDEELKLFITYYEDYQTKIFELSGEKLMDTYKIFGTEIFGNTDRIVKYLDEIIQKEHNNR
jgi:AAA15 family ATPase/GTPase